MNYKQDFENLDTTRLGNIGERIIKNILEDLGNVVYSTNTNKAHGVDFFVMNSKVNAFCVEVKTERRFEKYNALTINKNVFEDYLKLSKTTI